jgi:cobyrinic acid a,c-diamide synthase
VIEEFVDINRLLSLSAPIGSANIMEPNVRLSPLGQRIAVARDDAFCFIYEHLLDDWRAAGAELSFFSPLADAYASVDSDAVFLPGGYPELHMPTLAAAEHFFASLTAARDRNALIYGECGGYMVLGEEVIGPDGKPFKMAALLPVKTDISRPKRTLGYRRLRHSGPLPWPRDLLGHEFHFSSGGGGDPLFEITDAAGEPLPPMGAVVGRVMGSYAHVIDVA